MPKKNGYPEMNYLPYRHNRPSLGKFCSIGELGHCFTEDLRKHMTSHDLPLELHCFYRNVYMFRHSAAIRVEQDAAHRSTGQMSLLDGYKVLLVDVEKPPERC